MDDLEGKIAVSREPLESLLTAIALELRQDDRSQEILKVAFRAVCADLYPETVSGASWHGPGGTSG